MKLRAAGAEDAAILARLHLPSFDSAWSEAEFVGLLRGPGVFAVLAEADAPLGFVLIRTAADEAEVLTIAVDPERRRHGLGRALMTAALGLARAQGAAAMLLEVAQDNPAALALYRKLGFGAAGVRRSYYKRQESDPVDALVLRLALDSRQG